MPAHPAWRTLLTDDLELSLHWPAGRVPASLVVDDPMPGMNPMTDHDPTGRHRPVIPNDVLRRFCDLVDAHALQGKWSVVPWPLARGRLDRPKTLPPGAAEALPQFVDLVRTRLVPRFDVTCEFLTHARAVDPRTERILDVTEREWASRATAEEFADAFALAARILADAGLPMDGITSPWDSGADNEAAYARGAALAAGRRGRRLAWYWLHYSKGLDVLPRIAYRDERSLTVSLVVGGDDPGWRTQFGEPPQVDPLIDADGHGRLADLADAGLPVVMVTHWQSLYGNGSLGGLYAIDLMCARLRERCGGALEWVPLRRQAELAAACATVEAEQTDAAGRAGEGAPAGGAWTLRLRAPYPCDAVDLRLRARTGRGRQWLQRPLAWNGTPLHVRAAGEGTLYVRMPLCDGVLAPAAADRV